MMFFLSSPELYSYSALYDAYPTCSVNALRSEAGQLLLPIETNVPRLSLIKASINAETKKACYRRVS